MNGRPFSDYTPEWRRISGDSHSPNHRWAGYWMPALIHKGLIKATPEYTRQINMIREAKTYAKMKWLNATGVLEWYPVTTPSPDVLQMSRAGLSNSLGIGIALSKGYGGKVALEIKRKLANATLSMTDFLEYVLWTRDMGVMNPDWVPIHELCNPCRISYKYVMQAEYPEEANYHYTVLGAKKYTLIKKHSSIGATRNPFDFHEYENIPKHTLEKIIDMYQLDFELFGYDKWYV